MNSGQILVTMGALILISLMILNYNGMILNIEESLDNDRFRLEALSILTSHIEQTSQYFFDEASTDTTNTKQLTDFTLPGNLGADGNDAGAIDDIDDFDGTTVSDTGRSGAIYTVAFEVDYVELGGSGQVTTSSNREYHKRISIQIYDSFTPPLITREQGGATVRDTLQMSYVTSYWFYN